MEKHACHFTKEEILAIQHHINRAKYRMFDRMDILPDRSDREWLDNKITELDSVLFEMQSVLNKIDPFK